MRNHSPSTDSSSAKRYDASSNSAKTNVSEILSSSLIQRQMNHYQISVYNFFLLLAIDNTKYTMLYDNMHNRAFRDIMLRPKTLWLFLRK